VALSGAESDHLLTGPMPATRKALAKAKMQIEQIDLFEITKPSPWCDEVHEGDARGGEIVNVNGGIDRHGHPLGATEPCSSAP